MSLALQMGRSALKVRRDDFYETPECATRALLRCEPLTNVWEPACGKGAISQVLAEAGVTVFSSDLVDRGYSFGGVDFLLERQAPAGVLAVVTNPPFKLADQFIRHGLNLVPTVIMLLRWAYAEGEGKSDIIDNHLTRVWLGRERLPFMHREGYEGPRHSNSGAPFAWFVFERHPAKPGRFDVQRISWRENVSR